MLTLLAGILLSPSSVEPGLGWLLTAGFEPIVPTYSARNGFHRGFHRALDEAKLRVSYAETTSPSRAKGRIVRYNSVVTPPDLIPAIGRPVGDLWFLDDAGGHYELRASAGRFSASVRCEYRQVPNSVPVEWRRENSEMDAIAIDSFVRDKLGRLYGDSLLPAHPVIVSRVTCDDTLQSETGTVYIRMQQWAKARKLPVSMDNGALDLRLEFEGKPLVFTILANSYRSGDEWKPLAGSGYPVFHKNNWYIPLEAMEAATRPTLRR